MFSLQHLASAFFLGEVPHTESLRKLPVTLEDQNPALHRVSLNFAQATKIEPRRANDACVGVGDFWLKWSDLSLDHSVGQCSTPRKWYEKNAEAPVNSLPSNWENRRTQSIVQK